MKGLLVGLLLAAASLQAYAVDVTTEANEGRHGEVQLRVGPRFDLSEHWAIDTGLSVIKYENFQKEVGVADVTVQHRNRWGKVYLDIGTGLAMWSAKNWDLQKSETQWTFSNRFGAGLQLTKTSEVGLVWRHYSNLCYTPNTSKDFLGLHAAFHF